MSGHLGRVGAGILLGRRLAKRTAPVTVVFQVTDRCNYECIHCFETHGKEPELSLPEIDRILGELADAGVLFVTFTGGEFFMRKDADEILRAARRRKFAVKLLTTGHFIDERRADLIAELGLVQVDVSFYSSVEVIHDNITKLRGSWQRTLSAARRLLERKVIVTLKTPVMNLNADTLSEIKKTASDLGCEYGFDTCVMGRIDGDLSPTALRADDETLYDFYTSEELGYIPFWTKHYEKEGTRKDLADKKQTTCKAGIQLCGITPQGKVTACQSLPIPVGDLRKQSFREIWEGSPELERIRGLSWGKLEDCNACELRAYCNRCHAMAWAEDGDLAGPATESCRHALLTRDILRERGVIPATEVAIPAPLLRLRGQGKFREEQPITGKDGHPVRIRPPALKVVNY